MDRHFLEYRTMYLCTTVIFLNYGPKEVVNNYYFTLTDMYGFFSWTQKYCLKIIIMEMLLFPLWFRKHKKQLGLYVEINMILIFIIQTTLSFRLHHCRLLCAIFPKPTFPPHSWAWGNWPLCSDLLRSSPMPDSHPHTLK